MAKSVHFSDSFFLASKSLVVAIGVIYRSNMLG